MANDTLLMLVSWCAGDKCDPCQTVDLELFGNYQSPSVPGPVALCLASGSIISFPEFPVVVTADISLQGIYRPFVGPVFSDGGGSATISGKANELGVSCPFPSTFFQTPKSWNPSGFDQLLFNVTAKSSTTSAAFLVIGTVSIIYHPQTGSPIDVSAKARWTGNVS